MVVEITENSVYRLHKVDEIPRIDPRKVKWHLSGIRLSTKGAFGICILETGKY
jgi:hypothetical protein